MYKAVFFDIDGTLLSFKTHKMPHSTRLALDKLRYEGVKIFLATGRTPVAMQSVISLINYEFDGYVYSNGQYVVVNNKVIHDMALSKEDITKILEMLEKNKIAAEFSEIDHRYSNFVNERVEKLKKMLGVTAFKVYHEDPKRALEKKTYQMAVYLYEDEEEEFFKNAPGTKSVRWHPVFTDVIPKEGGKDVGIQKVLDYFSINRSESIAFGDGGNDADMLKYVGLGVAMGNAVKSAKDVADYVTDDVDNDGIYNALKKFGVID